MRTALLLLFTFILTSCYRDKGSYEIEGTFLDACTLEPLQRTRGTIYVYEIDSIQVNNQGYFHEENSWNVEIGWMQRPREYISLQTRFFDKNLQRSFFKSFSAAKGYTDMGTILYNAQLEIPLRFTSDTATCAACRWEVSVNQENSWRLFSYQNDVNLYTVPEFVINFMNDTPLEWNLVEDRPQNPIVLTVIEIDSARVRSVKQSIDISDQVNRCGLSDTLTIAL